MKNLSEVAIITNSMIEHPSGSDVRIIKLCKYFEKKFTLNAILSKDAENYFLKEKINAKKLLVTKGFSKKWGYFIGVIGIYIIRLVQSIICVSKLSSPQVFYSPTDLLVDVFPCTLGKVMNSGSLLVQVVHHIIPDLKSRGFNLRNILSNFSQQISLLLIKNNSDLIFVVNSQIKKELQKRGFENTIEVTGNGIDLEEINTIFKKFNKLPRSKLSRYSGTSPEKFDSLLPSFPQNAGYSASRNNLKTYEGIFVGRVNYTKGALDLIEIWKEIVHVIKSAKLVVVGNIQPEVFEKMQVLINKYGLTDNVEFKGYTSRIEMINFILRSKVLVYPSHEEGWGISIAEAMACHLPVVAYDLPVYNEVFPKGIIKHKIGETREMAASILELLDDKKTYQKYSDLAYHLTSNYSWKNVAEKEIKYILRLQEKSL